MKLRNITILVFKLLTLVSISAQSIDIFIGPSSTLFKKEYEAGERFLTSIVELRTGTTSIPACSTAIYISKNKILDAEDTFVGAAYFGTLNRTHLTIPKNIENGYYYFIVAADYLNSISETDENNNLVFYNIEIRPNTDSLPDLIPSIGIRDTLYKQNPYETHYGSMINIGKKVDSLQLSVHTYISKDKIFDESDDLLDSTTFIYKGINMRIIRNEWDMYKYDAYENGSWYIFQKVDAKNSIKESNEYNNLICRKVYIKNNQCDYFVSQIKVNDYISSSVTNTITVVPAYESKINVMRFPLSVILSRDTLIDDTDLILESGDIISYGGYFTGNGYRGSVDKNYTIPAHTLTPGKYYLLVCVDPSNKILEANEANNVHVRMFEVAAPSGDLALNGEQISDTTWTYPTGTINENYQLTNVGIGLKEATYVKFYLSSDDIWDGSDLLLGIDTGNFAIQKNSGYKKYNITIPEQVLSGDYYVLAIVDQSNLAEEYNESNNSYKHKLRIKNRQDLVIMPENSKMYVRACMKKMLYPYNQYAASKRTSVVTIAPEHSGEYVSVGFISENYNNIIINVYDGEDTTGTLLWTSTSIYTYGYINVNAENATGALTFKLDNYYIGVNYPYNASPFQFPFQADINVCKKAVDSIDLYIENISLLESTVEWNKYIYPRITYATGPINHRIFEVEFYLSKDTILSDDDRRITGRVIEGRPNTDTLNYVQGIRIDSLNSPGAWYLIALLDPQNKLVETNEFNNRSIIPIEIKRPVMDLFVVKVLLDKQIYRIGEKVTGSIKIVNNSSIPLPPTTLSMSYSTYSGRNWGSYWYEQCPEVLPYDSIWVSFSKLVAVGSNTQPTYSVKANADYYNVINEYNERNNSGESGLFIIGNVIEERFSETKVFKNCYSEISTISSYIPSPMMKSSTVFKPIDQSSRVKIKLEFSGLYISSDDLIEVVDLKTNKTLKSDIISKIHYFKSADTSGIRVEYHTKATYGSRDLKIIGTCEPFRTSNDLVLNGLNFYYNTNSNDKITIRGSIENKGINYTDSLRVSFFLSEDRVYSSDDQLLEIKQWYRDEIKILEDSSINFSFVKQLPSTLKPKVYYVIAILDKTNPVLDSDSTNNSVASPFLYSNEESLTDIALAYPRTSHQAPYSYKDMKYSCMMYTQQIDSITYPFLTLRCALSKDSIISSDDYWIYLPSFNSLRKNNMYNIGFNLNNLSEIIDPLDGEYYVIIKADYFDEIPESNENNNILIIPVRFNPRIMLNKQLIGSMHGLNSRVCNLEISNDTLPKGLYTSIFTLLPDTFKMLQLNFEKFNLQANHFIEVYEGTQVLAPHLLGRYTGQALPPITYTAGGPLTIRFVGDSTSILQFFVDCVDKPKKPVGKDLWSKNLQTEPLWAAQGTNSVYYEVMNMLSNQVTIDNVYYLSTDSILDASDIAISCSENVLTEFSQHFTDQITLNPSLLDSKYRYLIQHLDAYNMLTEIDEFNNIKARKIQFDIITNVENNDAIVMESGIELFPNPNKGVFEIVCSKDVTLEFIDAYGKLCGSDKLEKGNYKYDLRHLPSGLYMVRCINDKGAYSRNFIKE